MLIWVFGPISNGVLAEILLAKKENKPISYFKIQKPHELQQITAEETEMEEEMLPYHHLDQSFI